MRVPNSLTGKAKEFWKDNAPRLTKAGILTDADRDAFTLLCQAWQKLQELEECSTIQFVCLSKQIQGLMKAFGLTPESRKKLGINLEPEEKDEFGL